MRVAGVLQTYEGRGEQYKEIIKLPPGVGASVPWRDCHPVSRQGKRKSCVLLVPPIRRWYG